MSDDDKAMRIAEEWAKGPPTKGDIDTALLLAAFVADQRSPLERFVDALSDEPPVRAQTFARETVELRAEFVRQVEALLTSDPRKALGHAMWLVANAREFAWRWSNLTQAARKWAEMNAEPIRVPR